MSHPRINTPSSGLTPHQIKTLLSAAALAPSGDNTQPWQLGWNAAAGQLTVRLDPRRDPSPMNGGQRMARIACGAAVENIVQAVVYGGGKAQVRMDNDQAEITVNGHFSQFEISPEMRRRVTNRRRYEATPLPDALRRPLLTKPWGSAEADVHFLLGPEALGAAAELVGRSDRMMFGHPDFFHAFLDNVRFDRPPGEAVEEGLNLGSLELPYMGGSMLRLLGHTPDRLYRLMDGRPFQSTAKMNVLGASGLCLVRAKNNTAAGSWDVGRLMQRVWLTLTRMGLQAQPMMSPLIMANLLTNGPDALATTLGRQRLQEIADELDALFSFQKRSVHPGFLLRFGFAPAPTGRTGRLKAEGEF